MVKLKNKFSAKLIDLKIDFKFLSKLHQELFSKKKKEKNYENHNNVF